MSQRHSQRLERFVLVFTAVNINDNVFLFLTAVNINNNNDDFWF